MRSWCGWEALDKDRLRGRSAGLQASEGRVSSRALGAVGEAVFPDEAPLQIRTMRRTSSMATAYRRHYKSTGEAIEADPADDDSAFGGTLSVDLGGGATTTAYLIRMGEDQSSALMDVGDSTIVISGNFNRANFDRLSSLLEEL